jgi:anti-sigma regulatory factor (Ser/Thr protein kinase)
MDERSFPRQARLDPLFEFVDAFATRHGIPAGPAADLRLALEELFTNCVKYHPESRRDIAVRLEQDGDRVRMTIQDFDVDGWDLAQAPPFDAAAPLDQRRAGGMGLHLVRSVTDSLEYAHADRTTTITVTKKVAR